MARAGGCLQHSVAHLASSLLPHRMARPRCVAGVAGEDASLIILFLSAFSHLPPPLGSASWRWVDGRLSGAAASPTASPACLTKPAEGMLPFWAERFSLWAQFRGKSLVFRDSSEHPLSSAHSGSRGELAGSHREAALIAAPISKPRAAIPSPAARNHEGMLSSQGQHGPYPGPSPSPGPQWDPTAWSYCRRSTLLPAGGAVPLLGCLAPRHDLSVPQNC